MTKKRKRLFNDVFPQYSFFLSRDIKDPRLRRGSSRVVCYNKLLTSSRVSCWGCDVLLFLPKFRSTTTCSFIFIHETPKQLFCPYTVTRTVTSVCGLETLISYVARTSFTPVVDTCPRSSSSPHTLPDTTYILLKETYPHQMSSAPFFPQACNFCQTNLIIVWLCLFHLYFRTYVCSESCIVENQNRITISHSS